MVCNDNYIVIQGFMVNELKLKGNELLVYAIIYGFSQDGNNKFTGSLQYLADWTNCTKQAIINVLKSLIEKGLIEKEEVYHNNIKFVKYSVGYSKNFNGIQKSLMGIQKSLIPIKKSLPNNIDNNIIINNINIISEVEKEFGTLSPIQIEKLYSIIDEYNEELVLEALKECSLHNVRNISYLKAILKNWKQNNVQTKNDIQLLSNKRQKANKVPNWLENKDLCKKEEMTQEEIEEMEELLKEFKK